MYFQDKNPYNPYNFRVKKSQSVQSVHFGHPVYTTFISQPVRKKAIVNIAPIRPGSVDPHILADLDTHQGSQNIADPDPKHCL